MASLDFACVKFLELAHLKTELENNRKRHDCILVVIFLFFSLSFPVASAQAVLISQQVSGSLDLT